MKTTNPMLDARADRFVRGYLKTRHLVLLVELGRRGSIMQAAHAANLTQPAASKLLGELEHALGVPLFERLPRGVEPTWYGKVLIRRAGASLAEMDAACDEVMGLQPGLRGRVAIGAILTPSTTLVPRALALLKARHGHANASIKVDISRRLIECLRAGELDLVIGRIADAAGAGELDFEPVSDEPHGLIVRAGHPLLAQSQLALGDVAPCQWILPPEGGILRERIAALFASQDLAQPVDTVTAAAPPAIIALLMGSDMLAPMPLELVQPYLDSGLLAALPCAFDLRMDVYGIVTRRRHHLSPAAAAMLAALREAGSLRAPV